MRAELAALGGMIHLTAINQGPAWADYVARRIYELSAAGNRVEVPAERLRYAWNVVQDLLPHSAPTPSVTSSDDGGVALFWQRCGWDVVVELVPDGDFIWARDRNSGGTVVAGGLDDLREELRDILLQLAAG